MPEDRAAAQPSLEAKSPYELRVDLGKGVPEADPFEEWADLSPLELLTTRR
jgi:hypothetical protein